MGAKHVSRRKTAAYVARGTPQIPGRQRSVGVVVNPHSTGAQRPANLWISEGTDARFEGRALGFVCRGEHSLAGRQLTAIAQTSAEPFGPQQVVPICRLLPSRIKLGEGGRFAFAAETQRQERKPPQNRSHAGR